MRIIESLLKKSKELNKRIVFPEAEISDRIIRAIEIILKKKLAQPILLGNPDIILQKSKNLKGSTIINPKNSPLMSEFVDKLAEIRKNKGLTKEEAAKLLKDNFYFATMLVKFGYADGFVGGAETATSNVLRPALQIIKTKENIDTASSCFMMLGSKNPCKDDILFVADCALNINPNAKELCDIVLSTVKTAKSFSNISPKVAMLSFSSFGSGGDKDESILKIREAIKLVKERDNTIQIDGEMQLDCAIIDDVAKMKGMGSDVAGKANILIFPDLNSGNIGYKLIERFGKLQAVGVIMQGLGKPVNDLSRGCSVMDIVLMTAITSIQSI